MNQPVVTTHGEKKETPPKPAASSPPLNEPSGQMMFLSPHGIVPSPFNTRRTRDAQADSELVESVKIYGVIEPVIARPRVFTDLHLQLLKGRSMKTHLKPGDEVHELVAGERRWEAALSAGAQSVPTWVRELTDEQAREVQVIENDKRKDLDPIDRAQGYVDLYRAYLAGGMKPADAMNRLKERLKKEKRTVYNVMSLANLAAEGQAALRSSKITISHAYELAPLTPEVQKELLKWGTEQSRYRDGITFPTVRALKDVIRTGVMHPLDGAPWKKDDATLLPAAGACNVCPKNTAVNPELDPEGAAGEKAGSGTCMDPGCYDKKLQATLVQIETEAKKDKEKTVRIALNWDTRPRDPRDWLMPDAYKEAKKDSCKNVVTGLVAVGKQAGQRKLVCITRSCKQHWETWESRSNDGYASSRGGARSQAEKDDMRKKIRDNKLEAAARTAQSAAVVRSVKKLTHEDLVEVACMTYDGMDQRFYTPLHQVMGWKENADGDKQIRTMNPAQLAPLLVLMCLAPHVLPGIPQWANGYDAADLSAFEKRHKLGLAKAADKAMAPLRANFAEIDKRRKAKEKKDAKAKPAAKGKKK